MKIFIASPGDVKEERDIVALITDEFNRNFGELFQAEFKIIRWETDAWPDFGEDAQDVINRQIGEYDIFIGIMWKRFGTPTNRASSGTEEEFERAYNCFSKFGRPKIMFYFKNTPFYTTDLGEINQFSKVISFRNKLEDLGGLYWVYNDPLDFERNVRQHLTKQVLSIFKPILATKPEDELVLGDR
jgi:hypothetical protein